MYSLRVCYLILKKIKRINFNLLTLLFILSFCGKSLAVDIDPATPGLPAVGKVNFIIGQDSEVLEEFRNDVLDVDSDFPEPTGITLYTNLINGVFLAGLGADPFDEEGNLLPGFNLDTNDSYDFGANINSFPASMALYPNADIAIGLFVSDSFAGCTNQPLRSISAIENPAVGEDITPELVDAYRVAIDRMIETFIDWDRYVYLRIGYEFDAVFNCHGTEFYIDSFQYIAKRIKALGATKVATVWQAASIPRDEALDNPEFNFIVTDPNHYDVWYPGDEFVDYVGISAFYGDNFSLFQYSCEELNPEFFSASLEARVLHDRILNFARDHNKPVMLAEGAPQAYDLENSTVGCVFARQDRQTHSSRVLWDTWFEDWFDYIEANLDVVKLAAYINADWDQMATFGCADGGLAGSPECPSGVWVDTRIQNDALILERFKARLQTPVYDSSQVFGIEFIDADTALIFHEDNNFSADFAFLCFNNDCREAQRANNRFERVIDNLVVGTDYIIEFKVQDNTETSGQCLSGVQRVTFNQGVQIVDSNCD